jgi:hypothetical protein
MMVFTLLDCHDVDFPPEAIEVYSIGDYNDEFEQLNIEHIKQLCIADHWDERVIEAFLLALEDNVVGVMEEYADAAYTGRCEETAEDYYGY